MSEVRRRYTCPVCELRFLVIFDDADPLSDASIKIECARAQTVARGRPMLAGRPAGATS